MSALAARLLMNRIRFPLYFINPMLVSDKLEIVFIVSILFILFNCLRALTRLFTLC